LIEIDKQWLGYMIQKDDKIFQTEINRCIRSSDEQSAVWAEFKQRVIVIDKAIDQWWPRLRASVLC